MRNGQIIHEKVTEAAIAIGVLENSVLFCSIGSKECHLQLAEDFVAITKLPGALNMRTEYTDAGSIHHHCDYGGMHYIFVV